MGRKGESRREDLSGWVKEGGSRRKDLSGWVKEGGSKWVGQRGRV